MEQTDLIASGLPAQLRLGVMRLARRLRQQAAGQITASQFSALCSIDKYGEMTLGELAAAEQIAPPSMTRIAARLEEDGFVIRTNDPADRRIARVSLSNKGISLLADVRSRRDLYLAARFNELSAEEIELLERVVPIIEKLACDERSFARAEFEERSLR